MAGEHISLVFRGRLPFHSFETLGQVFYIRKTKLPRDLRQRIIGGDQHRCHMLYFLIHAIGKGCLSVLFFESPLDMRFADIKTPADIIQRYFFVDMRVDIILDDLGDALGAGAASIRRGERLLKDL